jgi:hypothetical protein
VVADFVNLQSVVCRLFHLRRLQTWLRFSTCKYHLPIYSLADVELLQFLDRKHAYGSFKC